LVPKKQPENGPCKLTSPCVARKFQEMGPLTESVSFPQCCGVHWWSKSLSIFLIAWPNHT